MTKKFMAEQIARALTNNQFVMECDRIQSEVKKLMKQTSYELENLMMYARKINDEYDQKKIDERNEDEALLRSMKIHKLAVRIASETEDPKDAVVKAIDILPTHILDYMMKRLDVMKQQFVLNDGTTPELIVLRQKSFKLEAMTVQISKVLVEYDYSYMVSRWIYEEIDNSDMVTYATFASINELKHHYDLSDMQMD